MESMREFSDRIADTLASGSVPWRSIGPEAGLPLRFDGGPYRGASVLSLWMTGQEMGFERPTWLSRQRIDEMGGSLKAGATPATAFLRGLRPQRRPGPASGLTTVEMWQACEVWCVDEIEGLPDNLYRKADELRGYGHGVAGGAEGDGVGNFLGFVDGVGGRTVADERAVGWTASELVRWTGSPARLNRDVDAGAEGLVAEIGAAVLLADFGVDTRALGPNRIMVTEAWAGAVSQIRDDERTIFQAARAATDAVEWLRSHEPGYRQSGALASLRASRGNGPLGFSAHGPAAAVLSDSGMTPPAAPLRATDEPAPLFAAQRARRVTGEALGFRHRPVPAGDDGGAWQARAASLIRDVAGLDLECARVRAAVEAEVAVAAARPGDVVSAETFVADFCEATQRRLQMADLATQHTRAMSIGETSLRI